MAAAGRGFDSTGEVGGGGHVLTVWAVCRWNALEGATVSPPSRAEGEQSGRPRRRGWGVPRGSESAGTGQWDLGPQRAGRGGAREAGRGEGACGARDTGRPAAQGARRAPGLFRERRGGAGARGRGRRAGILSGGGDARRALPRGRAGERSASRRLPRRSRCALLRAPGDRRRHGPRPG